MAREGKKPGSRELAIQAYHFWMMWMTPVRRTSGNQHLHRKTEKYRKMVKFKMAAWHRQVHLGCITQRLLQYLSVNFGAQVWRHFKSWMRTMNTDRPLSEMVVAQALRSSLSHVLATLHGKYELEKILVDNANFSRMPGLGLSG